MNGMTSGNAMTEVALALAMAFFSLMVLTMVSMGTPNRDPQEKAVSAATPKMRVALSAKSTSRPEKAADEPTLVVYWKGTFYDQDLRPLNLATQQFKGRVILALPPDLPMGLALEARSKVVSENLVVSTLNKTWLTRLSKSPPTE